MEHSKAQPPKDWTPIYTEPPRPGYDDYGKELGKEARVWKTYVQEASRWDADLVDGWNRFVIESSKKLQEDPAETSAKTLSAISQTLFSIANNQPGSPLNLTAPESDRFVIPASAVCINALWFLSLSLSIAVSLVAMLAKDWARGYVAELTGQPYQQARKRQRRWDGLKEWRVPEVIMFLPSLLHLALHPSPPSESLDQDQGQGQNEDLMDELTSRALAWLIVNYEDTKSADIALQAIAGANHKLPLEPLSECGAHSLIQQRLDNCFNTRLTTQKLYLKDTALFEAVLLYGRALTTPAGWSTIYWENSVTAFALVAIAVNGRQVGLKSEAYIALTNHLLHLHLKDQVALEEPALLALLRAATYWPCFYETDESISEHIRLMMTLVQLLPALGFSGESQMHGLVGAALTVFARLHQNYDSWPLLHNSDEREQRYQALTVARHYECFPPAVTTQTASLVIFGLLELLKNHTDNLGSEDLKTLFEALRCYGPRPASTINVFGLPQQVFGSDYRYMVETAIYVLTADNEGAYVWGEDARAVCIAAFNRSFAQESSQAVDTY
ncbi:hypothetical protein FRC07_002335 [Ceratobasidium sp. 392]|nr:hypothetical protein FRC07_002335 [Ceratobasidium sp. 392]